ncbi:hypothetical protein I302_100089 [Kwoniella bestiolae CBS 10118]|uniref:Uncharacterized protein n=1 Tax=Kwoniella bestiolae CBS 10118 TaxID=1296100 RepID=A0A1B9G468_9TREE|nr:hypothetical protein I302_03461 [Kwoniella bestiolae CBS 10118]OCF25788.1 hypothetical protein I302_03461 [Kwoniella bestiolae CBS 10118]
MSSHGEPSEIEMSGDSPPQIQAREIDRSVPVFSLIIPNSPEDPEEQKRHLAVRVNIRDQKSKQTIISDIPLLDGKTWNSKVTDKEYTRCEMSMTKTFPLSVYTSQVEELDQALSNGYTQCLTRALPDGEIQEYAHAENKEYADAAQSIEEAEREYPNFIVEAGFTIARYQTAAVECGLRNYIKAVKSSNTLGEEDKSRLGDALTKAMRRANDWNCAAKTGFLYGLAEESELCPDRAFRRLLGGAFRRGEAASYDIDQNPEPQSMSEIMRKDEDLESTVKSVFGPLQDIPKDSRQWKILLTKPKSETGYDLKTFQEISKTCDVSMSEEDEGSLKDEEMVDTEALPHE